MSHTPGPWETHRDGERFHIVREGTLVYLNTSGSHCQADWVAEIDPDGTGHDEEQTEADARLIAAAPDLLAACKAANAALVRMAEAGQMTPEDFSAVQQATSAAIVKAEGGAR